MLIFFDMMDVEDDGIGEVNQAKVSRLTVDFITAIRATVVSLGMYPPGSATIKNAVEKVAHHLQNVLDIANVVTFSEINGMLLINESQLEERDRKRAPVIDFIASMIERKISSITFKQGATSDELVDFLVILSKKPGELATLGPIPDQMVEAGIKHIALDERIYVATTQEEQEELKKREAMMEQFITGQVSFGGGGEGGGGIDPEMLKELLEDKEKFAVVASNLLGVGDREFHSRQDYVEAQVDKIRGTLRQSYHAAQNIDDEETKQEFIAGFAQSMADFEPDVLTDTFYEEALNPTEESSLEYYQDFFDSVEEKKGLEMVDKLIGKVDELRKNADKYSAEEKKARITAMKETVKRFINGFMDQDYFDEIAEKFTEAKLVKPAVIDQLKAKKEKERANGNAGGGLALEGDNAEGGEGGGNFKLLNSDSSIDDEALRKLIHSYGTLSNLQIPQAVLAMNEVFGEVVFHDDIDTLIDAMIEKLEENEAFDPAYQSALEFVEKVAKELIFNENYLSAQKILSLLQSHADKATERHPSQQARAAQALESIASEDTIRLVMTVYQHAVDEQKEQVGKLVTSLGRFVFPSLVELLRTSEDMKARRQVMTLCRQMGGKILDSVREELSDQSNPWFVIRNMIVLVEELGGQEHFDWVVPMLDHEEARVRKEAIKALAAIDAEKAAASIRPKLHDSDNGVKRFAISSLGALKDKESVETLSEVVKKRTLTQVELEDELQIDAVTALGKIGTKEALETILDTVKKEGLLSKNRTKTAEVRVRAIYALANFKSPDVKKALKAAQKDSNQQVKEAAKVILERMP